MRAITTMKTETHSRSTSTRMSRLRGLSEALLAELKTSGRVARARQELPIDSDPDDGGWHRFQECQP